MPTSGLIWMEPNVSTWVMASGFRYITGYKMSDRLSSSNLLGASRASAPSRRLLATVLSLASVAGTAMSPPAHAAEAAPFDLPGPALHVTVKRGAAVLPIGAVPALSAGDELTIRADLPEDQGARFLLLSAFLRGATNPPPEKWVKVAETWERKEKKNTLSLKVPEGARQLVLFLVPDTGGAADAITSTVRGRPGEFVRATQSLNQASLDRSRLDAFMSAIQAQDNAHPEHLRTIAPVLAQSLSIRLNDSCLDRVIQLQASCLLENRESLVLPDMNSRSATESIAGASTDLALQVSQTREAGYGFYSPYISVVRDIARIFGAFSSPQFSYLPTVGLRRNDSISLLLNTAPSFDKPKSVLVVGMPAVAAERPPQLRNVQSAPVCATRKGAVLPVDGTALIYSAAFGRNMALKISSADGKAVELPVQARADRGGYVLSGNTAATAAFNGPAKGRLHGYWGFEPFSGPEFALEFPTRDSVRAAGEPLVTGRDSPVTLEGLAPSCVESITLRQGSLAVPLKWKVSADENLTIALPMAKVQAGELALEVRQFGLAEPSRVALRVDQPAVVPVDAGTSAAVPVL